MTRTALLILIIFTISLHAIGQVETCIFPFTQHQIKSENLEQQRDFWVSLPLKYSDSVQYSVMYVLDAEWRFDLVRNIEYDYAANDKIDKHIIVGIPHIDWEYQRGIDLTFSESRMEYDGDTVDSSWYNERNSGGGMKFYKYLTEELIPTIDSLYSTNGNNTLVGHSLGGYFAGYLLSMDHPFSTLYLFDPSIWYSNGEVIKQIKKRIPKQENVRVLITYQPSPSFHKSKIEELIDTLEGSSNITLDAKLYENETHNSLFLPSFLKGISLLINQKL